MSWYRYEGANHLILNLHIQAGAKNTLVAGLHGDALKIKIAAPPTDGRANEVLVKFLAKHLAVPIRQVKVRRGSRSPDKIVIVERPQYDPDILLKAIN
jgi:uncharacterized protein (TIGR00251 family)